MRWLLTTSVALIATCSWAQQQEVRQIGQPLATTVQLPTFGVSFDAAGVLQLKTVEDPTGQILIRRAQAAQAQFEGNLGIVSDRRHVSLVRLQSAISRRVSEGLAPTQAMVHLAGLVRIDDVFCYPKVGDIIVVGRAEPWAEDLAARKIGIHSGRPTLLLADLATAMRVYPPGEQVDDFVGCTIDPRIEGLSRLQAFQRSIPRTVAHQQRDYVARQVAMGVRDSLGTAEIKVFGISPRTHFAHVMIEADYRMKRMAVGVEPPPVRMTTYAAALRTAQNGNLQRWWFTPDYDGLLTAPDRLAFQLAGQGVQLRTEDKQVLANGTIVDLAGNPSQASKVFASGFTQRYDRIASAIPVYAQLRQMIDFLMVAAFMQQHRWYAQCRWSPDVFLQEDTLAVNTRPHPQTAPVVVNAFWKQNRMFVPAGGGVSIQATKALQTMREDQELSTRRQEANPSGANQERWWWD